MRAAAEAALPPGKPARSFPSITSWIIQGAEKKLASFWYGIYDLSSFCILDFGNIREHETVNRESKESLKKLLLFGEFTSTRPPPSSSLN